MKTPRVDSTRLFFLSYLLPHYIKMFVLSPYCSDVTSLNSIQFIVILNLCFSIIAVARSNGNAEEQHIDFLQDNSNDDNFPNRRYCFHLTKIV